MTTINNLPLLPTLRTSDQFVVWAPNQGDSRRVPYNTIKTDILDSFNSDIAATVMTFSNKTFNLVDNVLTGTFGQFNAACSDADFVSTATAQTLTNKTMALDSNIISGTLAQFNTACTDDDFTGLAAVQTVLNKTVRQSTFYSDTASAYIDRSAIITIARDTVDPTGIVPSYWSLHDGNGDNTTFRGVSGGYLKSRDRSTITLGQRGVLYGLQLSVEPKFTRNNFPYDDAVCLVLQNEGVGKATEMLYIGETPRAVAFSGWVSGNTLTVTTMTSGTIVLGALLLTGGAPANTSITGYGTGTGGLGTYTLNNSFTLGSSGSPVAITGIVRDADAGIGIDASCTTAIYTTGDYDYLIDTLWGGNRSAFRTAMIRAPNDTNIIVARNDADNADLPVLQWLNDRVVIANSIVDPWTAWTPTITADTGTFTTVTLNTAETRYQRINGKVTARIAFQIVNAGTAAGGIQVTLPPGLAAVNNVWASGHDNSGPHALMGIYNSGTQRVRFVRTGGVNPIVAGNFYYLNLEYEVAS
jgi:hypothetical protein